MMSDMKYTPEQVQHAAMVLENIVRKHGRQAGALFILLDVIRAADLYVKSQGAPKDVAEKAAEIAIASLYTLVEGHIPKELFTICAEELSRFRDAHKMLED